MSANKETDAQDQQKWMFKFLVIYFIANVTLLVVFFVFLLSVQAIITQYLLSQLVPGIEAPNIPFYLRPFIPQ